MAGAPNLPGLTFRRFRGELDYLPVMVAVTEGSKEVDGLERTDTVQGVAQFYDNLLGRFYAICNCCSCCCGAMEAQRKGTPMIASSGYVAVVDADLCAGCGECAGLCQFAAISVDDGLARIDAAACMGCGACVAHCPQEAISLERDPAKGEPLEIQKLIAQAAQLV